MSKVMLGKVLVLNYPCILVKKSLSNTPAADLSLEMISDISQETNGRYVFISVQYVFISVH